MNELQFIRDMLGRNLSLREINKKYNLVDCVEHYHQIKHNYNTQAICEELWGEHYNASK